MASVIHYEMSREHSCLERRPLYPLEQQAKSARVCVTGATGYLAGSLIARLLAAGHHVNATCRDLGAESKLSAIKNLPGAKERLQLFQADLERAGSFDKAIAGCKFVFHLAAVFRLRVPPGKGRELVIEPSVQGVSNVLNSVNRALTVQRVVLTSSIAAIVGSHSEHASDHVYTEEDWNLTSTEDYLPYHYSKKLAEEKAVEICREQDRWSLVVLNPGMIFGPPITKTKGESIRIIRQQLENQYYGVMANIGFGVVDVDDVAAAHCLAMLTPSAHGRYLLVADSLSLEEIVGILREQWSDFSLPYFVAPYWFVWFMGLFFKGLNIDLLSAVWGPPPSFNSTRSEQELGMTYLPVKTTLNDMVARMIELEIVKDARKLQPTESFESR